MSKLGNVEKKELALIALENAKEYCEEVVLNRSFPSVVDGLKPAQRALMYTLYEETYKKDGFVKSAEICSTTVGRYHPHNPDTVYMTAVDMMDQGVALVAGQGSFSTRISDATGDQRYTNLKLSEAGRELFSTIDICEYKPSYNERFELPVTLKPRFPYHLFTSYTNIAFGTGSFSLPFNPKEIMTALLEYIKTDGKISTEELAEIIKGPDTYKRQKIYMTRESLLSLIEVGSGLVTVVCDIEADREQGLIKIRELPWKENHANLYDSLVTKINNGYSRTSSPTARDVIKGVKEGGISSNSNDDDINIVIKVDTASGYTVEDVVEQLYSKTNLCKTYSIELFFVNEDGSKLDIYSIKDIFDNCIEINKQAIKYKYETKMKQLQQSILEDKALEVVTREENKEWFSKAIFEKNKREICRDRGLSEDVIGCVFKGSNLNRLSDRDIILRSIEENSIEVEKLKQKLTDESVLAETIEYIEGLLPKLSRERQTEVIYTEAGSKPKAVKSVKIQEPTEFCIVVLTESGKLAKTKSGFIEPPYKDKIKQVFKLSSKNNLTIVSENFIFNVGVNDIPESFVQASTLGKSQYVKEDINIKGAYVLDSINSDIDYVFLTNKGGIKRLAASTLDIKISYVNGFEFEEGETIIGVFATGNKNQIFETITRNGFIKRLILHNYTHKSRTSKFAATTKLDYGDEVVDFRLIKEDMADDGVLKVLSAGGVVDIEYDRIFKTPYVKGIRTDIKDVMCILNGQTTVSKSGENINLLSNDNDEVLERKDNKILNSEYHCYHNWEDLIDFNHLFDK